MIRNVWDTTASTLQRWNRNFTPLQTIGLRSTPKQKVQRVLDLVQEEIRQLKRQQEETKYELRSADAQLRHSVLRCCEMEEQQVSVATVVQALLASCCEVRADH